MVDDKRGFPALVLIDIQKGFQDIAYWGGERNNPEAEQNAGKILAFWREKGFPVFHIRHCSTNPLSKLVEGQEGNDFQDVVKPIGNEPVIRKSANSAFIGTDLQERLDSAGISQVVIVGLTTDHCISTSVRMAGNLGYDTYLVEDATATFCKKGFSGQLFDAQLMHETAIASLQDEFAIIMKSADLMRLFE